jgi:phosphoglycolate phosphatase
VVATILLFDIDGTLIDGQGSGRRAMEAAFRAICGEDGGLAGLSFAGMTDRAIVRAGLTAVGRAEREDELDAVLAEYLRRLPQELEHTPPRALRGVDEILAAASARTGVAIGLGTGNVRSGAQLKLDPLGLWPRFAFGGFGCDAEDRAEVLRAGIERGAAQLRARPEHCRVVVIGDTPRDIEAARAVGARSLAVATSFFSVAELNAAGATWAVADLTAAEVPDRLLEA